MAIYEGILRHLAGSDSGGSWRIVFIDERICKDASRAVQSSACQDRFTAEEQAELVARLSDVDGEVRFVGGGEIGAAEADIFKGRIDGDVLLRVGPIRRNGGQTSVGGSYYCGGLCASGAFWLLKPKGHRWIVTGADPDHPVWIS